MYGLATRTKTREFVDKYGKGIALSIRGTGLFFPAVVAQSALESGYGERIPADSNNFGGIKYNPNLEGVVGYVVADTTEVVNKKKVRVKQKFSKFKDVESGFRAHIQVLMADRYKKARDTAKTPEQQILMVAEAGYTTTLPKKYLSLMKGIIEAVQDYKQLGRIS